jgi:hypothetical protein
MAIMMGMKDAARIDQQAVTESIRANCDAQVAMTREANKQNLEIMATFLTKTVELSRPAAPPTVDPALAAILASIVEGQRQTQQLLQTLAEGQEPEETEEEEQERLRAERLKGLGKKVKNEGMGALLDFMKELAVDELIDYLPSLKEQFPMIITGAIRQFQEQAGAAAAAAKAAAQAPPRRPAPPPPPSIAITAPPAPVVPPPAEEQEPAEDAAEVVG